MNFDEALRYLLSLGHETLAIKLGLKNIGLLLQALGNPQDSYPAVQIAGTNGKGSTATVLDAICHAAGIKTGLFTSPHLISITERIRIGGKEISPEVFADRATEVRNVAQRLMEDGGIAALPSFFEQVTAIALLTFRDTKVKLAILETGLGGRLDATSAAGADVVALTPIAFDHEEYLGYTLESIAAEKAAIIRPGSTLMIAAQAPNVLQVIREQCARVGVQASINECTTAVEGTTPDGRLQVTFETPEDRYGGILVGLRGRHQITNVALAIRLAEALRARGFAISRNEIIAGIESANHAGRLEVWESEPALLFDGAHNPAGARALRDYLNEFVSAPLTIVFGAMRDKHLDQMAEALCPAASHLVLAALQNPRAATTEALREIAARYIDPKLIREVQSTTEAISYAKEVTPAAGVICFTGSLYLIGEVQAALRNNRTVDSNRKAAISNENTQ
ncbi:MAG: folylpolyglutamate synthase/dihydrofolate synthase family protein [bacterium]